MVKKKVSKSKYSFSLKLIILSTLLLLIFLVLFSSPVSRKNLTPITVPKESFAPQDIQKVQNSAKVIFEKCAPQPKKSREECYKKQFDSLVGQTSFRFAQDTVYTLQDYDPLLRHCHVLSHAVANSAARINPQEWKKLLKEADANTCGAGFFHGVIEAHVGNDPNFEINTASIYEICHNENDGFRESTCNHIMGHLLLFSNEGAIETSLPTCSQISNIENSKQCLTGIFMEDSFKTILSVHGLSQIPIRDKPRMERQTQRCLQYRGIAAEACWIDLAELFQEYYKSDALPVYKSCNMAPEVGSQVQCYLKAVVLMAISPNFDSQEKLVGACAPWGDDTSLYNSCLVRMISSLMHYSPKFATRGVTLCSNINEQYQANCFSHLGQKLKMNVPSLGQREEFCQGTPTKYLNLCVQT